ncbi:MAG: DUF3995 domain-containing protein [Devosia sp.]|nr:DUF3995 domain-containing protein [Devosia sp.]
MSMLVAAVVFVPLLAVAIAHFVWSVGGTWPIRDEALLARTVVGLPGITRMPPRIMSFGVALATLAAGVAALALADDSGGGAWLTIIGALLAMVFLGRGAIGFTAAWRARFPEEPFATLDRKNYSPLCLAIGAGFLILVVLRLV